MPAGPKPVKKEKKARWGVYRVNPKPIKKIKENDFFFGDDKTNEPPKWDGDPLLQPYYPGIANISPELYAQVKERSGGICELCHKRRALFVHHLIIGKRRKSWLGNLKDLCDECHDKDGSPEAIHHNKSVYEKAMRKLQELYFSMGYNEEDVRFLLGTKSGRLFE